MAEESEKIRVKFETTAVIKRALQLRAVWEDKEMQEVVNDALMGYLATEIEEVINRSKGAGSRQAEQKSARKSKDEPR